MELLLKSLFFLIRYPLVRSEWVKTSSRIWATSTTKHKNGEIGEISEISEIGEIGEIGEISEIGQTVKTNGLWVPSIF